MFNGDSVAANSSRPRPKTIQASPPASKRIRSSVPLPVGLTLSTIPSPREL